MESLTRILIPMTPAVGGVVVGLCSVFKGGGHTASAKVMEAISDMQEKE